jgi:competence protein ComFB
LTEDIVSREVENLCASIEKEGQDSDICTCAQCRLDAACYVLNRVPPRYVESNRGAARAQQQTMANLQQTVDISVLVYKALKQVSHNQRPYFSHSGRNRSYEGDLGAVYNIPAIAGRLFNGRNFEPMSGVDIELRVDGKLVPMKDFNWQNPYRLTDDTEGTFTFWPAPVEALSTEDSSTFHYALCVKAKGFETLNHIFELEVTSEHSSSDAFSMKRTYTVKDICLFPEEVEAVR